jgi:transketolase
VTSNLQTLAINTIRTLSIDAVQKADSGHPGLPMGAAPMAYVLWTQFLRFNPQDPHWPGRDRFVLSAGHGSMLLYSLLHLTGYDLPLAELKRFRQFGSKTPGHPESHLTPGVEVSTGPLGQGIGNAIGMAMANAFLAATYNRPGHTLFDSYAYALVSDGDLMEGVASEACSLAGHLKLGRLIALYDDNGISLDGPTSQAFTEDVLKRFEAYGWHTQRVADGNDTAAIAAAIAAAQAVTDQPSIIAVRTVIGFGSPNRAGSKAAHGEPLGADEVRLTKQSYGWDPEEQFFVPSEVAVHMRAAGERGAQAQAAWNERFSAYAAEFPAEAQQLRLAFAGTLPEGWQSALPTFPASASGMATRDASGKAIDSLAGVIPWLIGGSADLASSTKTPMPKLNSFQPGSYDQRVIWFGVREHGMGAILNGMAAHGGVRVYGGTFLTFSDYMRGSIRLAAISHHPVTYVFTHDSIGVGEDGPTHQPVEHVAALRAIPHLRVIRPADANETSVAWRAALEQTDGPTALILSRQKLPVVDRSLLSAAEGLLQGAYVLRDTAGTPDVLLMASGSEVSLVMEAATALEQRGVRARVISFPCWELFALQPQAYRESVLSPGIRARIAVEAGVPMGWERWVGDGGVCIAVETFGASAPYQDVYNHYGLTVERIVAEALRLTGRAA